MPIHSSIQDMNRESVEEYLRVAEVLVRPSKVFGGPCGYVAANLLFTVIDAIGHHVNEKQPGDTNNVRLGILNKFDHGHLLSEAQIRNLRDWFRNPILHATSPAPNAFLDVAEQTDVFTFDEKDQLVGINLEKLFAIVRDGWNKLSKDNLNTLGHSNPGPSADGLSIPPSHFNTIDSFAVSGTTRISASPPASGAVSFAQRSKPS